MPLTIEQAKILIIILLLKHEYTQTLKVNKLNNNDLDFYPELALL